MNVYFSGTTTLSIMAFSVTTLMVFSITTICITAICITTLSIRTFSRTTIINNKNETFSITTLGILQSIVVLSIIYAECLEPFMLIVVMLSHAAFGSTFSKVPFMITEI
jgi:hypothetical protein